MKRTIYIRLFFTLLLPTVLLAGCKKTTDTVTYGNNDNNLITIMGTDEMTVSGEIEQAVDEAVSTLSISSTTSNARVENILLTLVPGADVDTTNIANGLITIYYYSKDKDTTKIRSGSVAIQLPVVASKVVSWKNAGTKASITFTNYEIKFLKTNTSVWMKGNLTLTNYSGGLQKNLIPGDSIVEKLRGQMQYSDNDNNAVIYTWKWNFHSTRVIGMLANNDITLTTRADTNVGGYNNVVEWGPILNYPQFYTSLLTPVFRDITSSSFYFPLSGDKLMNGVPEPVTITTGVDANGHPVISGNPYGFKLNWVHNSSHDSLVNRYY